MIAALASGAAEGHTQLVIGKAARGLLAEHLRELWAMDVHSSEVLAELLYRRGWSLGNAQPSRLAALEAVADDAEHARRAGMITESLCESLLALARIVRVRIIEEPEGEEE